MGFAKAAGGRGTISKRGSRVCRTLIKDLTAAMGSAEPHPPASASDGAFARLAVAEIFCYTRNMRLILTCLLLSSSGLAAEAALSPKPNILFFAVDDLRPELGCYGKSYIHSPNIDRIAKAGLVFNRAYCQQAVCSPSRASLMTGARPDTTQVWDLQTHFRKALPDVVTLGQHFKSHGYFVQGMGKIYHGGYDDPPTWSVPWTAPKAQTYGLKENVELVKRKAEAARRAGKTGQEASRASRGPALESSNVADQTFHDGALAGMAVEALREMQGRQQPFFLAVGFIRPHLPFVAPKKYWDLYDPAKIALAPNPFRPKDAPSYAVLPGGEMRVYEGIPEGSIPEGLARQLKHGYYAATSYMDAQVGKVLDELERLELHKNTIVILWGDHGWKLGEHDAWCKHSNVENDTNAPLLISVPGLKHAGQRTDALVEFVDIYPTLSELAGLPLPAHLEGLSFKPVLAEPQRPWKSAAFSQYPRQGMMGYSMRTDRYRYTEWQNRNSREIQARELYDHRTDPQENINLAHQPDYGATLAELSQQLKAGWKGALPSRPAPHGTRD